MLQGSAPRCKHPVPHGNSHDDANTESFMERLAIGAVYPREFESFAAAA